MNKLRFLILLIPFCVACCSSYRTQEKVIYNNLITTQLSDTEGQILNEMFDSVRGDFDFIGKTVAFMKQGSLQSSMEYFENISRYSKDKGELNPQAVGYLFLFSEEEKDETGGFDAAIYSWMKINIPQDKIVRRLHKRYDKCRIDKLL